MKKALTLFFILCIGNVHSQSAQDWLSKGNDSFLSKDYESAIKHYEKSLEVDPNYAYAMFNMGDAFFIQEKYDKARSQFKNAALTAPSKIEKANAYFNLASSYVMTAMDIAEEAKANPNRADQGEDPFTYLEEGIEALKDALRSNPTDEDARYNLAYLQKLMKQQPPPQEQENQDQKQDDKEQDDKDQEKQDKEKQDQEKQDQENKNDGNEDKSEKEEEKEQEEKESEEQKPQPREMSKEDAQRILDAIEQQEKEIREKLNLKKTKKDRVHIEKDW